MQDLLALLIPLAHAQTTGNTSSNTNSAANDVATFIVEKVPLWITAALVLVVSFGLAIMAKNIAENKLAGKVDDEQQEVVIITGRITFMVVAAIGVSVALAIAGIDLTTMLAAIGFGVSFGLQDVIANFVAGLGILISRPFKIGDWVKVNDNIGKIIEIKTRATYLKTVDGLRLIVPNAELYKSSVLSYTSNSTRRIKVYAYCRYDANMDEVMKICLDAAGKEPKILQEPKPMVVVGQLYDSYIEVELRFWVVTGTPWRRLQSKLTIEIEKVLQAANLDAPYPVTSLSFEEDAAEILGSNKGNKADEDPKPQPRPQTASIEPLIKSRLEASQSDPSQFEPSQFEPPTTPSPQQQPEQALPVSTSQPEPLPTFTPQQAVTTAVAEQSQPEQAALTVNPEQSSSQQTVATPNLEHLQSEQTGVIPVLEQQPNQVVATPMPSVEAINPPVVGPIESAIPPQIQ